MDEQLRSELFAIYCFVFDLCAADSANLMALYCEFVKYIAHNYTQSMIYTPDSNLSQLIHVKLAEVHQELSSRPGKMINY